MVGVGWGREPGVSMRYEVARTIITPLIIYKQQFLNSDWLRTCQLIPNQCKKV